MCFTLSQGTSWKHLQEPLSLLEPQLENHMCGISLLVNNKLLCCLTNQREPQIKPPFSHAGASGGQFARDLNNQVYWVKAPADGGGRCILKIPRES